MTTTEGQLRIIRTFKTPRDLLFKVWTETEHLSKWWGPKGSTLHVAKHELKPQGLFHYRLTNPDGHQMWAKFIYREIDAPEKLVFLNCFSDEEGNTVPAPFGPEFVDFPLEVNHDISFAEADGGTTLTITVGPHNATPKQQAFYQSMFESMRQGFDGSFDELDGYLEELQ